MYLLIARFNMLQLAGEYERAEVVALLILSLIRHKPHKVFPCPVRIGA